MLVNRFIFPFGLWLAGIALAGRGAPATAQTATAGEAGTVITNAAAVRNLTPAEAARKSPLLLHAVVTFIFDRHACFVQDQTAGIFVGNGVEFPEMSVGDLVEVTGVSGPGEYAPTVTPTLIKVLGHAKLPVPLKVTYDDLLRGQKDSQWVEVSGLVHAVVADRTGSQTLELNTGGGRLAVLVPDTLKTNLDYLVDSQVRIQGVCGSWFNRQRQLFGIRLLSPGIGQIVVDNPPAVDVLTQPCQPIGDLMLYAPNVSYGRRVKVAGTVLLQQPGRAIFVQDDQHGLFAQTLQPGILQPGDRVQLIGYPVNGEYTPTLQDAVWEKAGAGREPAPEPVTADEALDGSHDSRLVQVAGTLINRSHDDRETVLLLEQDKNVFTAHLESQNPDELSTLQTQSRLRLTGVCRIEVGEEWRAGSTWRAKSFRILLRSPADIQVLTLPPWWSLTRLLWAVGILTAVVLASLAWVFVLRRRVSQQTSIIRRQLDLEGTLRERYQDLFENAKDVVYTHDLGGRITSINMAGLELLGYDRSVITHRSLLDFVAAEQRSAAAQWLELIRDGKAPENLEWDFIAAKGERLRLEISTRLIEREGREVEVEGLARDVTERRRLEKEILEISTREQQRIGHDLHDGICQQLAGIGFLSNNLADKLKKQKRPEADEAMSISQLVNQTNKQTRGVARGLFPVQLEENGLISALEVLAKNAVGSTSPACEFHCSEPIQIRDQAVANHLYYIAQEAIYNAVKHGNARRIEVRLVKSIGGDCLLTVRDDGTGLPPCIPGRGMGIRIMKYRARMIGAELLVQRGSGGGTEVACRFVEGTKSETNQVPGPPAAPARKPM